MFNTEFTYINNIYRLVVDSTLAVDAAAWLEQQGVTFDSHFKHEGFCKFRFITAPDKAIALISAKYPIANPVTAVVPEPVQDWSGYEFVKAFDTDSMDNGFWIQCPSPELAVELAAGLPVQTFIKDSQVHFADSDMESTMTPELFCQLVECFGEPSVYWKKEAAVSSYYFADCCTPASIKAKYRSLSKLHHPDLGGDSETFMEIANQYQEAIASLS